MDMLNPHDAPTLGRLQLLAPQILARLAEIVDLPEHGTVAGQAVASILLEELGHPVRGPINDVDLFVNPGVPPHLRGRKPKKEGHRRQRGKLKIPTVAHGKGGKIEQGRSKNYAYIKFIAKRISLKILQTYQDGLRNFTLISSPSFSYGQQDHSDDISLELIQGFDLNLVSVGINLTTGTLVATDQFLDFLKTREIKVQTCNTPVHTLVRLTEKHFGGQIQGAWCDFHAQRRMLELALACQKIRTKVWSGDSGGSDSENLITSFGARYLKKYLHLQDHLPELSKPESMHHDEQEYQVYTAVERDDWTGLELQILEMAGREVKSLTRPSFNALIVRDFPEIYDLIHLPQDAQDGHPGWRMKGLKKLLHAERPQWSSLDAEEERLEQEAWEIRLVAQALGSHIPEGPLPLLDKKEVALLFFDQHCTSRPDQALKAVQAWKRMSETERRAVFSLGLRADWILHWERSPIQAWGMAMKDSASDVLRALSNAGSDTDESFQLASQILDHIAQHKEEFWSAIKDLSPAQPGYSQHPDPAQNHNPAQGQHNLATILYGFTPQERQELAHQIIQLVAPEWPEPFFLNHDERLMTIFSLAHLDIDCPEWMLENIHFEEVESLLPQLARMVQGAENHDKYQDNPPNSRQRIMDRVMTALVEKADDTTLLSMDGLLLRICALQCSEETLFNIIRNNLEKDGFTEGLELVHMAFSNPGNIAHMLGMTGGKAEKRLEILNRAELTARLDKSIPEPQNLSRQPPKARF